METFGFFKDAAKENKIIKTSDSTLQVFMTRKGKVGLRYSAAKKKLPGLKEEFPAEQEPITCPAGAFHSPLGPLTLSGWP